jgi:hypothetical protein
MKIGSGKVWLSKMHNKPFWDSLWDHQGKLEFPLCKHEIVFLIMGKYKDYPPISNGKIRIKH